MTGIGQIRTYTVKALIVAVATYLIAAVAGSEARAQPLVADLSNHLVAITTGFTGTDVLLFGAIEGKGDVVIVVRGPESPLVVRRKARFAGVWANSDQILFRNAPTFYSVASNRTLEELAPPEVRQRHQIGVEHVRLEPAADEDQAEVDVFRAALVRNKQREGLYPVEVGKVNFLTGRLFRTDMFFPANVPTGTYTVEVFLIRDGVVVSAQATPLIISKIGLGADIFLFAHRHSALYGLLAVFVALMAGWAASVTFRRMFDTGH